jgi:hypothetical protein
MGWSATGVGDKMLTREASRPPIIIFLGRCSSRPKPRAEYVPRSMEKRRRSCSQYPGRVGSGVRGLGPLPDDLFRSRRRRISRLALAVRWALVDRGGARRSLSAGDLGGGLPLRGHRRQSFLAAGVYD